MASYVKIFRSIQKTSIWQCYRRTGMWLRLKLLEEYEAGSVCVGSNRKRISYTKGQKVIQLKTLCALLEVSHRTLRDFLELLQEEGLIIAEIYSKYTIITYTDDNERYNQFLQNQAFRNETVQSTSQSLPYNIKNKETKKERKEDGAGDIAYEDKELKFMEEIRNDDAFFEYVANEFGMEISEASNQFSVFCSEITAVKQVYTDASKMRQHFINRVRKLKTNQEQSINKNKTYEARRGTPATRSSDSNADDSRF